MGSQLTNVTMVSGDDAAGEDAVLAGLRRGLGRDGISIPAYQTLGVDVREATAGSAVVRLPRSPHLVAPDGGLLPGAFAILADACCGCAVAAALPAGGAALTAQLRVEFIRPLPVGHTWIEGRAEAAAVDDSSGLARAEIIDEADQLLGVASLRVIKASHQGFRQATPAASARAASAPAAASGPAAVQAPTPASDCAFPRNALCNCSRHLPNVSAETPHPPGPAASARRQAQPKSGPRAPTRPGPQRGLVGRTGGLGRAGRRPPAVLPGGKRIPAVVGSQTDLDAGSRVGDHARGDVQVADGEKRAASAPRARPRSSAQVVRRMARLWLTPSVVVRR